MVSSLAPLPVRPYKKRFMGQQHRVKTKRKRRQAYLERKKEAAKATRRIAPKPKARKQASTE